MRLRPPHMRNSSQKRALSFMVPSKDIGMIFPERTYKRMEAHLPKLVILGIFCMMDAVKESTQKMGKKHPPQHCTEAWMGSRHWSQDPVESARFPSLLLCLFPGPEFCLSWLVNHRVLSLGWHLMQTPQHCLWSQICLPHWDQLAPGTKLSELHRRFWKKCVLRGYKHFISASKSN